jgi:hypothetical protein
VQVSANVESWERLTNRLNPRSSKLDAWPTRHSDKSRSRETSLSSKLRHEVTDRAVGVTMAGARHGEKTTAGSPSQRSPRSLPVAYLEAHRSKEWTIVYI